MSLESTPYYHCIARCVRRAWLCGRDSYTGKSFEHRKPWVVGRVKQAAAAFSIDVCAYAVMSNHLHLVLRVDADSAAAWSDAEVARRYKRLFPGVVKRTAEFPDQKRTQQLVLWRERLTSISWFMRFVCEHIARRANREDQCTGRFWEGRFKSQALLDEAALLTAMSYVDLNPIRACVAESLHDSAFTSIAQRIQEAHRVQRKRKANRPINRPVLAPMRNRIGRSADRALDITGEDYRALLKWTVKAISDERGDSDATPPRALAARAIDADAWTSMMRRPSLKNITTLGMPRAIEEEASRRRKRWLRGKTAARKLFRKKA